MRTGRVLRGLAQGPPAPDNQPGPAPPPQSRPVLEIAAAPRVLRPLPAELSMNFLEENRTAACDRALALCEIDRMLHAPAARGCCSCLNSPADRSPASQYQSKRTCIQSA